MFIRILVLFLSPFFAFSKVYDCFPFYNELELLKIRLHELDKEVDFFVLVEATKTFQNKEKELFFEQNKQLFKSFLHKIIHVIINDMPEESGHFSREAHQRNSIMRGLVHAKQDDLILIGDVDEIPKKEVIAHIKKEFKKDNRFVLGCKYYWGYLNKWAQKIPRFRKWDKTNPKTPEWPGTIVVTYEDLKKNSPAQLREVRKRDRSYQVKWDAGWHFSWQGGIEGIIDKVESYSHSEYNNAHKKDRETIKKSLENKTPFLKDGSDQGTFVPIDESFPDYVRKNQAYYERIGFIKKVE
jgi:beta-1,4-mannosyl-glycoprotein beta-1,4-N-acetylglucosaminyltransferase